MLDRAMVARALNTADWSSVVQHLVLGMQAHEDVEAWRLGAMIACARVLERATGARDVAAQIRELVRLADGHVVISPKLIQAIPSALFPEFALVRRAESTGGIVLELANEHPVFDAVPDLRRALSVDATVRRNNHAEPASAFLRRLSPHHRFASAGQKAALNAVVTMPPGATLVTALPTGWGKSALFQVGVRRWREDDPTACAVVVVPTVALAQDHARSLASMPGLTGSRALVGGMSSSTRNQTLEAFSAGDVPILFVSPEMAMGSAREVLLQAASRGGQGYEGSHLAALVVDEAHIVASWGRHFRPDFQRLPGLVTELRVRQPRLRTLLLSATLNGELRKSLRADFADAGPSDEVVVTEPRDEFDFVWRHVSAAEDRRGLAVKAADLIPRPAIIYTTTVEDAEDLHGRLRERGYQRLALFTGELDDPAMRQDVLESWAGGTTDLIVATSAFGMGVDKPNVRAIVHACLPEDAERFYQEIGRGGRDGHQALSLCLWTDGDASTAASLAIHGWMRPETSTRRWRAILAEASSKGYIAYGPSGNPRLKVPLDARHEGLDRVTGQLNRQWNAALLTLLQRSGALRIVGEERTPAGADLWVAEVLAPAILVTGPGLDRSLAPFLSVGAEEAAEARSKAAKLEAALLNEAEACARTLLFDMVDPSGSPWPCGRCSVCVAVGENPRRNPSRHEFQPVWSDQPWTRLCRVEGGAWVAYADEAAFHLQLPQLLARLAAAGIEQFVTSASSVDEVETSVCSSDLVLGLTLELGGSVPTLRVPTAVLLDGRVRDLEYVRKHCLAMRTRFEADWRELPLVFVLSTRLEGAGVLSQHLSSHAPKAESDLVSGGSA